MDTSGRLTCVGEVTVPGGELDGKPEVSFLQWRGEWDLAVDFRSRSAGRIHFLYGDGLDTRYQPNRRYAISSVGEIRFVNERGLPIAQRFVDWNTREVY